MTLFPTRRAYAAFASAFICFAVYASLIPFNARPLALGDAVDVFRAAMTRWPSRVSRPDVLANILLFVPIGFTLTGALLVDRSRHWRLVVAAPMLVVLISIIASAGAEFVQTFTQDRLSTPVDVASQTVGCLIGIGAWMLAGPALTDWVRRTLASAPNDRLPRVLAAYTLGWMFVNLAPFDITLDVGDLGRRVRSGEIALLANYGPGAPSTRLVWDATAEILGALPLGVAGLIAFPPGKVRSRVMVVAIGLAIVMLTEIAQVFIRSHAAIVGDAVLGGVGVTLGVWIGSVGIQPGSVVPPSASPRPWSPAIAAMLLWCIVLGLYHWQPYDFSTDGHLVRSKLARISMVPFAGYARGRWINALNDILTKVSLAAPLGVIAAFVFRRLTTPSAVVVGLWTMLFLTIFAIVEFGQLFVTTRNPDPTDILTGTVAAVGGLLTGYWLSPGRSTRSRP